jgi:hypothetical protein
MKVIGLSFVNLTVLNIVMANKQISLKVYPSDGWKEWLEDAKGRRMAVGVIEDRKQFRNALNSGVLHLIVLADYDWLTRRGIRCLDAKREGDNLIIKNSTPDQIRTALIEGPDHETSEDDTWIAKGNPEGRCAGCELLSDCGHDTKIMSKRPCQDQWRLTTAENAYKYYSLSHLIHFALGSANEDALLMRPKEFWKATFDFATGNLTKNDWISQYGRALRTAGTPKGRLQDITLWVKKYGSVLRAENIKNPPTKADVKVMKTLLTKPSK